MHRGRLSISFFEEMFSQSPSLTTGTLSMRKVTNLQLNNFSLLFSIYDIDTNNRGNNGAC